MIRVLIGNIFESECQTLVNTVNCVGVMGKGIAQIFRKDHPDMFEDYKSRCERGEVRLGEPYLYTDLAGTSIINFPTKNHWRAASRISDIERGLDHFIAHFRGWGITSVAFPPLGCGNGGLSWEEVGPLMYGKLRDLPIEIEIYAPYGTPLSQTRQKFLEEKAQGRFTFKGERGEKLNPSWIVLLEVLKGIQEQPYAKPVGRVIFQKICYILTEMGVETGFHFKRGSYGPFSEDAKRAITQFANRNWLREDQLGRMTTLRVAPQFEQDRTKFEQTLKVHRKKIAKTVDLFSRIKDTGQAEEVVTILYSTRELKKTRKPEEVSERDVYDFILDWKKSWRTDERKRSLAESIQNLEMLNWVSLRPSRELTKAD